LPIIAPDFEHRNLHARGKIMSTVAGQNDLNLEDINIFDNPTLIHPWAAYEKLRDEAPVHYQAAMNGYAVTRYDLIMEALRDTETYSSKFDAVLGAAGALWVQNAPADVQAEFLKIASNMLPIPSTMLTLDPPQHTQYRSLVNRIFTAGNVRKMEPYIQNVIDETIDGFIDKGSVEFNEVFAFPVPLRIIADRLGIPDGETERAFFYDAATAAASGLRLTTPEDAEVLRRAQLGVDLQQFLIKIAAERRRNPADDMISILVNAKLEEEDRLLTDNEIIGILNQFLVAGHETTASTFGWGMYLLCRNPEVQDDLFNEQKLISNFVEEVLRLEAPVQGLPRVVTKDTELGGHALKAGEVVILRYGAANRDERQFGCPNDLDVRRKNAGAQLGFGGGAHACIGSPLARQELNLGFPALLNRMKNFRLTAGHPEPEAEPSFILRSLPELHIDFDKR
jgi:cytochrome P450